MAKFSGPQYRGASRVIKELKREEAEKRQADYDKRMAELKKLLEKNDIGIATDEPFTGFDK